MKNMTKLAAVIAVTGVVWLLCGCSESAQVALHEPGQYKGKRDPLLDTVATSAHREQLRERLLSVQTDR